jgi:hypothetical protein
LVSVIQVGHGRISAGAEMADLGSGLIRCRRKTSTILDLAAARPITENPADVGLQTTFWDNRNPIFIDKTNFGGSRSKNRLDRPAPVCEIHKALAWHLI